LCRTGFAHLPRGQTNNPYIPGPPSNGWGFFGGPELFGLAGGRWACVFPTPCGGGANVSRALGTGTYHSLRAPHANVFSQNTLNMVSPFALRNNQRHIVIITNVK